MAPPKGFDKNFREITKQIKKLRNDKLSRTLELILKLPKDPAKDINWREWAEEVTLRYEGGGIIDDPDGTKGSVHYTKNNPVSHIIAEEYEQLVEIIIKSTYEDIQDAATKGNRALFIIVDALEILQNAVNHHAISTEVSVFSLKEVEARISSINRIRNKALDKAMRGDQYKVPDNTLENTDEMSSTKDQSRDAYLNEHGSSSKGKKKQSSHKKPIKKSQEKKDRKRAEALWVSEEPGSPSSKKVRFDLAPNQTYQQYERLFDEAKPATQQHQEPEKKSSKKRKGFIAAAVISSVLAAGAGALGAILLLSGGSAALIGTAGFLAVAFPWVCVGVAAVLAVATVVTAYKAHHSKDDNTKDLGQLQQLMQGKTNVAMMYGKAQETELAQEAKDPMEEIEKGMYTHYGIPEGSMIKDFITEHNSEVRKNISQRVAVLTTKKAEASKEYTAQLDSADEALKDSADEALEKLPQSSRKITTQPVRNTNLVYVEPPKVPLMSDGAPKDRGEENSHAESIMNQRSNAQKEGSGGPSVTS